MTLSSLPTALGLLDALTDKPLEMPTDVQVRAPFDKEIVAFLGALSRRIARDPEARTFPEIIALAHWMRPAALADFEQRFQISTPDKCLGAARGLALHFAPANVDTIFLYSCVLSLLAGNPNIVRLSARGLSPQTRLLLRHLENLQNEPEYVGLKPMMQFVTYPHNDTVTAALSMQARLRVIWGGDQTVSHIRTIPLHPLGRDISFPDRWSVAVFDAHALLVLPSSNMEELARQFSNDSYWFHQMACSSPRAVIWRGEHETVKKAQDRFWPEFHKAAGRFLDDFSGTDFYQKRLNFDQAVLEGIVTSAHPMPDNLTQIGNLADITKMKHMPFSGGGNFVQHHIRSLSEISNCLDERCQTITSFGILSSEWKDFMSKAPRLADRIVPVGQALAFSPIWDGMELIREFTRFITIE